MTYYSLKKIATSTVVVVAVPLLFCLSIILESLSKYDKQDLKKVVASTIVGVWVLGLLCFSSLWISASDKIASAEAKQQVFLKPIPLEVNLLGESPWTWEKVVFQGLGTTTFERVVVRIGQKDLFPSSGSWKVKINGGEGDYHLIITGNPSFPAPGIIASLGDARIILVDGLFPKKEEVPVPTISEAMKSELAEIWDGVFTPATKMIARKKAVNIIEVIEVTDSKVQAPKNLELFDTGKFKKTSAKIDWKTEFTPSDRVEATVSWKGEERTAYIRRPELMFPDGDCGVFESLQDDSTLYIFYRGPHGI